MSGPAALVEQSYGAFMRVVSLVDEEASWAPTGCLGWAVRDLVLHHVADAQRALVAFHTPADPDTTGDPDDAPDRDEVSYWTDWAPDPVGAANGRRYGRVLASMFTDHEQLLGHHLATCGAVVSAARTLDPDQPLRTQGHVLTAGALLSTLAVEATIHHLDLVVGLPDAEGPSIAGLAEVRRVLDALVGRPAPADWDHADYARVTTGRADPSPDQVAHLQGVTLPIFG